MTRLVALAAAAALAAAGLGGVPASAAPAPVETSDSGLRAYVAESSSETLQRLGEFGVDRQELTSSRAEDGKLLLTVVLSPAQASELRASGVDIEVKPSGASARVQAQDAPVFRPYSGAGGLYAELQQVAAANPGIAELVEIGQSVQGKPMVAVRVTKDAQTVADGSRPATLYMSGQHAREWITPEMTRRLLHHYLDNYGTDATITELVDTTELWFLVVSNPDGYDFTFTEGNRLWRKNLRDNNGDGQVTVGDGVDLNRNFATKWGYDNEGSSPSGSSETFRGAAPTSEPETQALDGLFADIGFEFLINYHSAAELLLYGTAWQVATPTPDDAIYEAMAGTDANPAVPGYDPDIAAELYIVNGDTDTHAHATYGTLGFTPEMTTCETASAIDPDDEFEPEDCESGFNFPDSEVLIQAEFEKNIPFALSVAQSAVDPDNPVTVTGLEAPDFVIDPFPLSYGTPQTVAVNARRALDDLKLRYSINGGRTRTAPVAEWGGGERYGDELDVYYGEFRGKVVGARGGDRVKVWFTATGENGRTVQSDSFTYRQAMVKAPAVLIVADEDIGGVNPTYPAGQTLKYPGRYRDALAANRIGSAVYNSERAVPHDLGVLGHFDAVIWYLGDNRLTQDPEDEFTDVGGTDVPDVAVAETQQYLTLAMRDYLNAGGKLMHSGETASYFGLLGGDLGGIWYGLDGAPSEDCVVVQFADECLILSDDFTQYYLGAFDRLAVMEPSGILGIDAPLADKDYVFGDVRATRDNPLDEAGAFSFTSTLLPPDEFPQFLSWAASRYASFTPGPFDPVEGEWFVAAEHSDDSYMRLARTVDLGAVSAADAPQLQFQLSFDVESGWDNVIFEAHTVGADDWTTLAAVNDEAQPLTDTNPPDDCEFTVATHPFLLHYLTPGEEGCAPTGTSGEWNRMTGNTGGWQQASVDLSAFAGAQVEVSISYVTDVFVGGDGVFVDDTRLVSAGGTVEAEGFETGFGPWATPGAPEGSLPNPTDFERGQSEVLDRGATVMTPDTVLDGFGFEHLATRRGAAADYMGRVMDHLLQGGP